MRRSVGLQLGELGPRSLLAIQKRVAQDEFFVLDRLVDLRDLAPALRLGPESALEQLTLVHLQLLQESGSYLQVLAPRVDKFERFEHAPAVPAHNKRGNNEAGSILRLLTLDEHALVVVQAFVDEVEDLVRYLLTFIEQHLLLVILPVQREVLDANVVPVVVQLRTSRIHDLSHLIRYDEFQVLRAYFIAHEQTVLDLDDSNVVVLFEVVGGGSRCRLLLALLLLLLSLSKLSGSLTSRHGVVVGLLLHGASGWRQIALALLLLLLMYRRSLRSLLIIRVTQLLVLLKHVLVVGIVALGSRRLLLIAIWRVSVPICLVVAGRSSTLVV